jgi:nucleoid-associated protein YgaU
VDPATFVTLGLAVACGIPTLLLELGRVQLPRPRLAPTIGSVIAVLALLRLTPAGAALPPPSERIEVSPALPTPPATDREEPPVPTDGTVYVVAPGDSLWAIACRHLSSGRSRPTDAEVDRFWRQIYSDNAAIVGDDPDLIFPGQRLVLPSPR